MPAISLRTSVAANSSSGNVLAGSPYEFVSQNSIIQVAMTNPAGTPGNITADFQVGGESLSSQANISTRNAFPTYQDDTILQAGATPGERLFLNLNNTTAGALNVDVLLNIQPL